MSPNSETIARIAEDVAAGRLRTLDGTLSPLGQRISAHWRRRDFVMTRDWVLLSQDWTCPGCGRTKFELTRLDQAKHILARIVEHHDHMLGAPHYCLYSAFKGNHRSAAYDRASEQISQICRHLSAFESTLVCEDCNNVDAAAAKEIGAPPDFSFSPQQIRSFVKPLAHGSHRIDAEKLDQVWREIGPIHAQRLNLMSALVDGALRGDKRLSTDDLRIYDRRAWYAGPTQPSVCKSAPPPYWRESVDGEWGTVETELALNRALNVPSDAALARWRTVPPPPARVPPPNAIPTSLGRHRWLTERTPANWRCPICDRTKQRTYFVDHKGVTRFEVEEYRGSQEQGRVAVCSHCAEVIYKARQELSRRARLTWAQAGELLTIKKLREMVIPRDHGPPAIRADLAKQFIDAAIAAGPRPIQSRQQSFDF
jgi:rubredoxin